MASVVENCWSLVDRIMSVISVARRHAVIYGPPGTGKTFAAVGGGEADCYTVTITPDTGAAELRGHYVPRGGEFHWHDGPATRAWREGKRLVLNEVDHAGADCVAYLLGLLDSPESAQLTLPTGETIKPREGFHAVATMNGVPGDLLPALADRFSVAVAVDRPHPAAVAALPNDLQKAAAAAAVHADPARRVGIRTWQAYAALRGLIGEELAAAAAFGTRGADILASLKIAE